MDLKKRLFQQLQQLVDQRVNNAREAMEAAANSKGRQTKSSAGDKFETGRAMMQAEEDRSKVQLIKALALQKELSKINIYASTETVQLGSLVYTNRGNYFLSLGLGKVAVDETPIFAISLAAPIGSLLLGKKIGEKVSFREQEMVIQKIS